MTSVVVQFMRDETPYNKGDIAGFLPAKAVSLTSGQKAVAKVYDVEAAAKLKASEANANSEMADREAALADREAKIEAREKAIEDAKTPAGAPPAQGGEAKKGDAVKAAKS